MLIQTWGDVVISSFQEVWLTVAGFLPLLVGAMLIFLVGWIIAAALARVIEEIVRALRVDALLIRLEINKPIERAGWKLNTGVFFGALVKWFIIIASLLAASNILGLSAVSQFLRDILLYIPNVAVAALILVIAAFIADLVERFVRGSAEVAGHRRSAFIALISRWAIWTFALLAALLQLGIAQALVQTLLTGLVAALALAFGLAFSLGGRDVAAGMLQNMKNEMTKKS